MGVAFDSSKTKQYLKKLHKNFKMIRHPLVQISLWSHH